MRTLPPRRPATGRGGARRIAEALRTVGLAGFERRPISTLSGGQFQKTLFARLLVQDASLILLDEPFAALDSRTVRDLMELVKRWHGEARTVIAVLHDLEQVPCNFYQIQTKFRDEIRPRYGVMRAREFVMKDAYSFHVDQESFDTTYQAMFDCYCRVLDRAGLEYRAVEADSGNIGGAVSHEFHVLADSGEDSIVFSTEFDYAANMEKAEALAPLGQRPEGQASKVVIDTPGVHTIDELVALTGLPAEQMLKTLIVVVKSSFASSNKRVANRPPASA